MIYIASILTIGMIVSVYMLTDTLNKQLVSKSDKTQILKDSIKLKQDVIEQITVVNDRLSKLSAKIDSISLKGLI